MTIYFSYYISEELEGLSRMLEPMLEKLNAFFKKKSYARKIEVVYYGIICVNPNFDDFSIPKRMYFSEQKGHIELEFKLDFKISKLSQKDIEPVVANAILAASSKLKRKKKLFNYDQFNQDLEIVLDEFLLKS
jgi:hypothetical protein